MSDRIALLRSGELEQVATPRDIYFRPATAYVAQFIGHTNLLKANVQAGVVRCGQLSWRKEVADGPALFSLRPEHIRVAGSISAAGSVRVRGRILHQDFHGSTELIRVQTSDGTVLVVRTPSGISLQHDLELEFSPENAIVVRESPMRN
jgi:ABC-type Fe3+/spermidine/putrescine transport system ATPase subunit